MSNEHVLKFIVALLQAGQAVFDPEDFDTLKAAINELATLRETLRWRKYPEEKPEVGKLYNCEIHYQWKNQPMKVQFALLEFQNDWTRDVVRYLPLPAAPEVRG